MDMARSKSDSHVCPLVKRSSGDPNLAWLTLRSDVKAGTSDATRMWGYGFALTTRFLSNHALRVALYSTSKFQGSLKLYCCLTYYMDRRNSISMFLCVNTRPFHLHTENYISGKKAPKPKFPNINKFFWKDQYINWRVTFPNCQKRWSSMNHQCYRLKRNICGQDIMYIHWVNLLCCNQPTNSVDLVRERMLQSNKNGCRTPKCSQDARHSRVIREQVITKLRCFVFILSGTSSCSARI
jgi:hypothetical protein